MGVPLMTCTTGVVATPRWATARRFGPRELDQRTCCLVQSGGIATARWKTKFEGRLSSELAHSANVAVLRVLGESRMHMSSSMCWRSGETAADGVEVETSSILLLSLTEADCLDRQHRRVAGATNRRQRCRSAYREYEGDFPPSSNGVEAPRLSCHSQSETGKGKPMNEITGVRIARVGVDLAKQVIQVHAVDASGRRVVARAFKRDQFFAWCTQLSTPIQI